MICFREAGVVITPVRVEKLANLPGKTLSVVTVHYAPGAASSRHHHAGSVPPMMMPFILPEAGIRQTRDESARDR